jgi:transcriptional regulator with XRE-family HTH domain
MDDIKEIIADNLIKLRKKNNLTQGELAEKLNYSDNAVSRWERGEVTPSVETLEQISKIFNISITSLFEKNIVEKVEKDNKKQLFNRLAIVLIFTSLAWFGATVGFVYAEMIFKINFWQIFVWAVPASCLILYPFNKVWGKYIWKFVILSVFVWTVLVGFYVQFIEYNIWLIFIIGVPVQAGLAIWAFLKPKE